MKGGGSGGLPKDFLVLSRMILAYRSLMKTHQQLMNKYRALSDVEREVLKPAISSMEKQTVEMAKKITEEAGKRHPHFLSKPENPPSAYS